MFELNPAWIPLSVVLFAAAFVPAASGAAGSRATKATDVTPGEQYESGARLRMAVHGVSWQLPDGWIGGVPLEGAAFLMGSNDQPGIGLVIPVATTDDDSLAALLHSEQDLGDGVVLEPIGEPTRSGEQLWQTYGSDSYTGRAVAVRGPHAQSVVYCFAGPKDQADEYDRLLQALVASLAFESPDTAPLAAEWDARLRGMALRTMSSYNSGGGSGGYSSESTLDLCSSGAFQYDSAGATSIYVPGATGSGVHEDRSAGRWSVGVEAGQPVLVLQHEDGRTTQHLLGFDGEKTFLDGERVFRVESENCR